MYSKENYSSLQCVSIFIIQKSTKNKKIQNEKETLQYFYRY